MRTLFTNFLRLESASAIVLFTMTVLALLLANSPFAYLQQQFIGTFLFTINEGLMALFFLIVGLELKREYLYGNLSQISQVILPFLAAVGGMLVPAAIYWAINHSNTLTLKGWSTPVATDVAFALGVLSLFGKRVPVSLKLFLLALAIFDDIGAITIIALFYSKGLSFLYISLSALIVFILYSCKRAAIHSLSVYIVLGVLLWVSLWYSGIHPTVAGVLLALTIPSNRAAKKSPLHRLESLLHPYVAFIIIPLFALANAGLSFKGLSWDALSGQVAMGIILGLFIGKQVGVFGFSWLLMRFSGIKLPENTSWLAFYGVTLICGIGFTMSLFLGTLSFQNDDIKFLCEVRLGVIIGSMLSGMAGAMVLLAAFSRNKTISEEKHR